MQTTDTQLPLAEDLVNEVVEKFAYWEPLSYPSPASDPAIPGEVAELRKLFAQLTEREEEVRRYVDALGGRIKAVQHSVVSGSE